MKGETLPKEITKENLKQYRLKIGMKLLKAGGLHFTKSFFNK